MAELEGEAFLLGHWRNVEEMEDKINIFELNMVLKANRLQKEEDRKFAAALKGIKYGEDEQAARFEEMKRKAEAKARGMTEEEAAFGEIGVGVMDEETLRRMLGGE